MKYIGTNDIQCPEIEIFRAGFRWIKHDDSRSKYTTDIFKQVRFHLISIEDLWKISLEQPSLQTEECQGYIADAMKYHNNLYSQPLNDSIIPRGKQVVMYPGRDNSAISTISSLHSSYHSHYIKDYPRW